MGVDVNPNDNEGGPKPALSVGVGASARDAHELAHAWRAGACVHAAFGPCA